MAIHVARHDFRAGNAEEAMAPIVKSAEAALADIETSDYDRADSIMLTLATAKWRCLTDPAAETFLTWEAWLTAMQVSSALFVAGTADEGTVACRIGVGDSVKNLPATGPREYLHAGNWLTAFYLAVICRENERINLLVQVPISFLRASGAEFDEYIYSWVETLQNRWAGRQETWETLVAAVNGTDPEAAQVAGTDLMLQILYPPLELFQLYLRGETGRFNESLERALVSHKQYWTANESRALSGEGLVALAPLAIACLARDDGNMPLEVESEYLPKELLEFGWAGEVDE